MNILKMLYTLRFFLQNAVCFIMLTGSVPVLFTFYIQCVLKLKKNNSGAKVKFIRKFFPPLGCTGVTISHRPGFQKLRRLSVNISLKDGKRGTGIVDNV